MAHEFSGQLVGQEAVKRFVLGGHAVFTLVSKKTGTRYTYKLSVASRPCNGCGVEPGDNHLGHCRFGGVHGDPAQGSPIFAKVLTGPENTADYEFVGTVRARDGFAQYTHSGKSRISDHAPSVQALCWFLRRLGLGDAALDSVEVWHDGRCGRCGRPLTVPESVASGLGPICAGRA